MTRYMPCLDEQDIIHQSETGWSHQQGTLNPLVNWLFTTFSTNQVDKIPHSQRPKSEMVMFLFSSTCPPFRTSMSWETTTRRCQPMKLYQQRPYLGTCGCDEPVKPGYFISSVHPGDMYGYVGVDIYKAGSLDSKVNAPLVYNSNNFGL